ncbi:DNA polymerase IV [Pedobacter frigiditerrae]|uniref:DNA polymerase IV n=1 Tax=Pedobacter frigiditerrae TaxID=2530452 RepID=A0A4R0MWZ6_9SPHI|nr:DNA polymerase IV [Pedobacter frigiditerrae]TCC90474.1 DNA polymerase IV [Pedobacter frigiditerrae]
MENESKTSIRKIIHIDMDAFYASVEQRDFPEYRGKPLVVGGSPEGRGGVVATASYEARKFGIKSAMTSKKAQQLCPYAIFVRPRFDAYKDVSRKIREIFSRYTDLIEPLSLDEAYLDVSEDKLGIGSAITIAEQIKQAIKDELNLTASAGVSVNKFAAKIASDMNKPDGLTFIGPSKMEKFMEKLPVEKFFGVGKVTAEKMKRQGLHTGLDLKKQTEARLIQLFGKTGKFFYNIVRGIDNRQVQPHQEIKSISAEDTFSYDVGRGEELDDWIEVISKSAFRRLQHYQIYGRTITLKVKFGDFKQITRSLSFPTPINELEQVIDTAKLLLNNIDLGEKKIRLLGVGFSNFGEVKIRERYDGHQQTLFPND